MLARPSCRLQWLLKRIEQAKWRTQQDAQGGNNVLAQS
jgi:hypothetical protein